MLLLPLTVALARDVVLVGDRYAPASSAGWPGVLGVCLDTARPGAFAVVDGTSLHPAVASLRRALEVAPTDAVVIVAMTPPEALGPFGRVGWPRALEAVLEVASAGERDALLFGPWPAERRRMRASGSAPDSAIGIREDEPHWEAAGAVAARAGVPRVPWEGSAASVAAALPPADRSSPGLAVSGLREPAVWADLPGTDPGTLGRLACAAVLDGVGD